eukprot:TRINITY_DN54181_c0_g1_i1.p1 TRINITY_DN54181_c0_g1~~TRINITY_DN54181_c0_g1_i1.p1  ORF type:complete len:151 (-),score=35.43 TRINITY_DN54181_c0_g1_i1:106-558(-)
MPGRTAVPAAAQGADSSAPGASAAPAGEGRGDRAAKEVIDVQAVQETAARTVQGAKHLFGSLSGWVREAQSAVADSWGALAEEGVGPLEAVRRRAAEKKAEATASASSAASKRRDASRSDAAQYFVEYKGLDPSLLPPELLPQPAQATRT